MPTGNGSRQLSRTAALGMFDLTNRLAIVTGASSGLGAEVSRALASAGARVALVARRADRLSALATDIGAVPFPCDLLEEGQLTGLVDRITGKLGPPDILVNNAGDIFSRDPAEAEPVEAIRKTLELNLVVPFRLSQAVFPHMASRGRGAILHVSSISGHVGMPGYPQASYAASKLGLSGLTTELAVQWGRHGIRVNCVAPGFFPSEINTHLYEDEHFRGWLRHNSPLSPAADLDAFTGSILWLVSDAGRHVTGQTVKVDGGWSIQ